MLQKLFTVSGTGDSLFVSGFPADYPENFREIADWIGSCDLRITNLETNLDDFGGFASAYSGGTWLNTRKECLGDLLRLHFNYCGTANNHAMDYSYHALLSTLETLESSGVAHSGTGRSLNEAAAPAILRFNEVRAAVFAVDCSFENASRAGNATASIAARPGVNYLRHETRYLVSEAEMKSLKTIAEKSRINFSHDLYVATGFVKADAPDCFTFGKDVFTTKAELAGTFCNAADKKRLLAAITRAKAENDYVFILVHCHDNDGYCHENPPEYLCEFARDAVDAGVSAVFGGGCHSLRGIEFYYGAPIFYSLGDFIYQGGEVEKLPADFMEKWGADIHCTAKEALNVRSQGGKVGLQYEEKNYLSAVPKMVFADGKLLKCTLLPIHLNFTRKDKLNGLPVAAKGADAEKIFGMLQQLSRPFSSSLQLTNDLIVAAEKK